MLKFVRKRIKIFLWILLIAFLLWGIGAALSNRQNPGASAGTLYGRAVPLQEYQAAWEQTRHRAILTYGERAMTLLPPPVLDRQAWDTLLLLQAAHRAHLRAGDREVIAELRRWPLFQRDGRFDARAYELIIRYSLGTTPRAFEEEIRGQLAIRKLLTRATDGVQATEPELEAAYRTEAEAVRVAYLTVEPAGFSAQAAVGDAEMRAYHQAHAADFQSEPQVKIRYLAVTPERLRNQVHVAEADVLEEYLRQAAPGERGMPPSAARLETLRQHVAEARAKERAADLAWELREQWKRTPDLGTLGRPHHLVPRETPFFALEGAIPEIPSSREVARAAFALKPGELSPVIETPEADYLITLVRAQPATPLSFEEAAPKIREALRTVKAQRLAQEAADNLWATVQEQALAGASDPLAPAARAAGLKVARTEFVKRASPIGASHETAAALLGPAFELEAGRVGGPWRTSRGWVIAQLLERQPIDREQFSKAKDRLRTQILERKRAVALDAWLRKLRAEAKPRPNPQLAQPQSPPATQ